MAKLKGFSFTVRRDTQTGVRQMEGKRRGLRDERGTLLHC